MKSIILLIFSISLFNFCSNRQDEWSPQKSDLLFVSNKEGNTEIYLKVRTAIHWINLTNNKAADNRGVWSPDGKKIAFQSTRSGNQDIWIMDKDGSALEQLTDNPENDIMPSWVPDGSKITFISWRQKDANENKSPHIYIMNKDGSDQRRLIEESPNTSESVSWHPSGEKFISAIRIKEKGTDIFESDLNGKLLRQLTNDTLYTGSAEYSPDGLQIVCCQDSGNSAKIVIMNSDGSDKRVLLYGGHYPHWSPDGKGITYSSFADANKSNIDVYAVSLSDTSKVTILVGSEYGEAEGRWCPVY